MEHCKQEKKILSIENSQNDVRDLVIELRVSNEYQKKHLEKLDRIIDDYGKGIDRIESNNGKLELIIKNQAELFANQDKDIKKILESHDKDIKKLQDERNINVIKVIVAVASSTIGLITVVILAAYVALKNKIF